MSKARVFSISQTDKPPKHNSEWMCDYKMVQLIGPCMNLDWPKEKSFHIYLKSEVDAAMALKDEEIKMLREQRDNYISEAHGEGYYQHVGDVVNDLENEIQSALQRLAKG